MGGEGKVGEGVLSYECRGKEGMKRRWGGVGWGGESLMDIL